MHAQLFSTISRSLTLYLIETSFNTFANRAVPDQAVLVRAARSGSIGFTHRNMLRYAPALVDLTSNFFVLCTNMKFIYIIILSGWSLA